MVHRSRTVPVRGGRRIHRNFLERARIAILASRERGTREPLAGMDLRRPSVCHVMPIVQIAHRPSFGIFHFEIIETLARLTGRVKLQEQHPRGPFVSLSDDLAMKDISVPRRSGRGDPFGSAGRTQGARKRRGDRRHAHGARGLANAPLPAGRRAIEHHRICADLGDEARTECCARR